MGSFDNCQNSRRTARNIRTTASTARCGSRNSKSESAFFSRSLMRPLRLRLRCRSQACSLNCVRSGSACAVVRRLALSIASAPAPPALSFAGLLSQLRSLRLRLLRTKSTQLSDRIGDTPNMFRSRLWDKNTRDSGLIHYRKLLDRVSTDSLLSTAARSSNHPGKPPRL